MPAETKRTHHLNLQETQLEMVSDPYTQAGEDFEGKLREAQKQLEQLQQQRAQLEQQKHYFEDLARRKEEFVSGQIEMCEKLSGSLTAIDREVFELRQELDDLDQTRQAFAAHLERLEKIEPESWARETLGQELNRSNHMLDQAEEEFETAVAHFAGGRTRGLFGGPGASRPKHKPSGEFRSMFRNGLAFNLPVVLLGALALILYLLR